MRFSGNGKASSERLGTIVKAFPGIFGPPCPAKKTSQHQTSTTLYTYCVRNRAPTSPVSWCALPHACQTNRTRFCPFWGWTRCVSLFFPLLTCKIPGLVSTRSVLCSSMLLGFHSTLSRGTGLGETPDSVLARSGNSPAASLPEACEKTGGKRRGAEDGADRG